VQEELSEILIIIKLMYPMGKDLKEFLQGNKGLPTILAMPL
jgi:hypothetical protein